MTLHYTKPLRNDASPVWVGDRYLNAADTEREHERVRGRLGVDSEGVSTHNGGGDGGHVVAEERLGRGAASAVHSGVVASCPSGEATRLARARKRRTVLLLSAPDDSMARRWMAVPLQMASA